MLESTRRRLLDLNRQFYATIASEFDQTRQGQTPGLLRLLDYIPTSTQNGPISVLDVGCGNGRFAHILEKRGVRTSYVGVDNDKTLLTLAEGNVAELVHTEARFVQADLSHPEWSSVLKLLFPEHPAFDVVLCTATMQHLPGYDLRLRVVQELAEQTKNLVILSAWQFLSSERFQKKLLSWENVGLSADVVESGDGLLPWKQGKFAIRYVHQLDEAELLQLASDANLHVVDIYRADGREGNLNLYIILGKSHG